MAGAPATGGREGELLMTEYEQIAALRRKAADALTGLANDPPPESGPGRLTELRQEIRDLATSILDKASAPVSIATVGGYSNGKSALLGALLGAPRLLPTNPSPTTGNVTVLRLRAGTVGAPTSITEATVEFMTVDEIDACITFILDRLVEHSEASGLDLEADSLRGARPRAEGWERVDAWCRTRLWGKAGPDNLGKQMALELARIRDALGEVHQQPAALGGRPWRIDPGLIAEGVNLPAQSAVPTAYPEYRPRRRPLTWADPLGTEHLAAAFPLIRRIVCTVSVDPRAWPLEDLHGLEVEIRDFPGLGADGSGSRDLYLSRHELRGIDAILAVLHAPKPVTHPLEAYYAQLRTLGYGDDDLNRATVVAANFFDQVGPPVGAPATRLNGLLDRASLLRDVCVAAENLTVRSQARGEPLDRLVLVSALAALAGAGVAPPGIDAVSAVAQRSAWSATGQALARGDEGRPGRRIAELLGEYGYDSGLSELRRVVEEHARVHGLANKIAQLRRAEQRLDLATSRYAEQLTWLRNRNTPTSDQDGRDLRELVGELAAATNAMRRDLAHFRAPHRLTTERDGTRVALLRAIAADSRQEVDSWPHWGMIIDRLDATHPWIRQLDQATGPAGSGHPDDHPFDDGPVDDDVDDDLGPRPDNPQYGATNGVAVPNHGSVLVDQFARSAASLVTRYRAVLLDVVGDWEGRQRERFALLEPRLADERIRALVVRLFPDRVSRIDRLVGDARMRHRVATWLTGLDSAAAAAEARQDRRRRAAPFDPDRRLPWHPEVIRVTDEVNRSQSHRDRHVFTVNRMRLAAESRLTELVQGEIVELLARIGPVLDRYLDNLGAGIPSARHLEELLRTSGSGS